MATWWFLGVLALTGLYAWLMESLGKGWESLPEWKPSHSSPPETRVSVVVPVRNEEAHLERCLTSLLQQDYPPSFLEIIVVDDFSTDNTVAIASEFAGRGVRLLRMEELTPGGAGRSSKKKALQVGIQASKGALIATFDGDSWAPPAWLSTMVAYYEHHHPVLLAGPVGFTENGSLLEQFQALDMCGMTSISAAGLFKGWFHLGNGTNLLYERDAFLEIGGFEGADHLASGDDVFTMQKMAKAFPGRLAYVKSGEALVWTEPVSSWKAFWDQRLRWGSKASEYKEWQLTAVAALTLAVSMAICFPFCSFPGWGAWAFLFGFGLKSAVDYRLLNRAVHFFHRESLLLLFWKAQLLHVLYIVCTGSAALFVKNYHWKGRRLR
ncbi:MAG: glycosyltransferase [Saprospirales bacterium]|nr:glycosyltransferase [Saprospirales bacterium]